LAWEDKRMIVIVSASTEMVDADDCTRAHMRTAPEPATLEQALSASAARLAQLRSGLAEGGLPVVCDF
jgi:hypothetical protein